MPRAAKDWTPELRKEYAERMRRTQAKIKADVAAGLRPARVYRKGPQIPKDYVLPAPDPALINFGEGVPPPKPAEPPPAPKPKRPKRELTEDEQAEAELQKARDEMKKFGPLTLDDQIAMASMRAKSRDDAVALPWARHLKNLQAGQDSKTELRNLDANEMVAKLASLMQGVGQSITDDAFDVAFRGGRIIEGKRGTTVERSDAFGRIPTPEEVRALPSFDEYLRGGAPEPAASATDDSPADDEPNPFDPVPELSGATGNRSDLAGEEPQADAGVGGVAEDDRGPEPAPDHSLIPSIYDDEPEDL